MWDWFSVVKFGVKRMVTVICITVGHKSLQKHHMKKHQVLTRLKYRGLKLQKLKGNVEKLLFLLQFLFCISAYV